MQEFREDVRSARMSLMDEAQQPVISFRAPSFSIVERTTWAFDVLAEEGFQFDSSVFPVKLFITSQSFSTSRISVI